MMQDWLSVRSTSYGHCPRNSGPDVVEEETLFGSATFCLPRLALQRSRRNTGVAAVRRTPPASNAPPTN